MGFNIIKMLTKITYLVTSRITTSGSSFLTVELIIMEPSQASYAPVLDWRLSHIACKFTELRKKTNCYCEWRKKKKKDDLKFFKSCETLLFIWFLESSYVAVSLTFFFFGLFCCLWYKADFAISGIKTIDKNITGATEITNCVQEAQKSKLIFSTIVSLQH